MSGYLYRGSPVLEQVNADIMADRAANGTREPRERKSTDARCGTEAGYIRHRRHCEQPCQACITAATTVRKMRKIKEIEDAGRIACATPHGQA